MSMEVEEVMVEEESGAPTVKVEVVIKRSDRALLLTVRQMEDEVDFGLVQLGSVQLGKDSGDFEKRHHATSIRVRTAG